MLIVTNKRVTKEVCVLTTFKELRIDEFLAARTSWSSEFYKYGNIKRVFTNITLYIICPALL